MGAGFSAIPLPLFSGPAEHRPLENVNATAYWRRASIYGQTRKKFYLPD
jgi:hypothetical protein